MSLLLSLVLTATAAGDLPPGFEDTLVFDGLDSPTGLAFAPDGRLFVCERIQGRLRVANPTAVPGEYTLESEPYATFEVPHDGVGNPLRFRSSGLRTVAFDPDFTNNGYVYAFYMRHEPRQNRVVRIQQSSQDPDRADPNSEQLLIELPFAGSGSSGSHNGGGLAFGADGYLYATTGDGWSGGDDVQSLESFTGKVLRIARDGEIPSDNPFYDQAQGDYRAIYALGLRNPFSVSRHPTSQALYIGDVGGPNKASVYRLSAAANFGHDGYDGLGLPQSEWINAASMGGKIVSGGTWYAGPGPWPADWEGSFFASLWGGNGSGSGDLVRVVDEAGSAVALLQENVAGVDGQGQALKPVQTQIGPDGFLYYVLTTYETSGGSVRVVRPSSGGGQVATPAIDPDGGSFAQPVWVDITTTTAGAQLFYTLDGSEPNGASTPYSDPLLLESSATLKARGLRADLEPSEVASATFRIQDGPNVVPIAEAGPRQEVQVGTRVLLNAGASSDPDGLDDALGFVWTQIAGPGGRLLDANSASASFLPQALGRYEFEVTVSDAEDSASDRMVLDVVPCVRDFLAALSTRWAMDEATGETFLDSASGLWNGQVQSATWSPRSPYDEGHSLAFDGQASRALIQGLDGHPGGATPFSLSLWMRAEDFDVSDARLISKATSTAEQDHVYMLSTISSSGVPRLRFRLRAGGVTSTLIASSDQLEPQRWIHVAAVYDGQQMRLYQDGQLVGTTAKQGALDLAPELPVALGNQPPGAGERPFHGQLDEVRLYAWALSVEAIATLASRDRHEGCEGRFESF